MANSEHAGSVGACCAPSTNLAATTAGTGEETLGALLQRLEKAKGLSLAFTYGGRHTKAGYHVTEVKSARVTGLDCGANVETWDETIIQLWDIETSVTGEEMTVDKFAGIIRKYMTLIGATPASRLTFEVSDDGEAMRIFSFQSLDTVGAVATIRLEHRAAACKPLVRGILKPAGKGCGSGPRNAFQAPAAKPGCCG